MTWDLNSKEVKDLKLRGFASVIKKLWETNKILRIEIKRSVNNKDKNCDNIEILIIYKIGSPKELDFDISKTFNKQYFTWKQNILCEILGTAW